MACRTGILCVAQRDGARANSDLGLSTRFQFEMMSSGLGCHHSQPVRRVSCRVVGGFWWFTADKCWGWGLLPLLTVEPQYCFGTEYGVPRTAASFIKEPSILSRPPRWGFR